MSAVLFAIGGAGCAFYAAYGVFTLAFYVIYRADGGRMGFIKYLKKF